MFLWNIFRDKTKSEAWFEPLAVIEHRGSMTRDGEGQGHYICDVKSNISKTWHRTNDNNDPISISRGCVTKNGVVILYKQKKIWNKISKIYMRVVFSRNESNS